MQLNPQWESQGLLDRATNWNYWTDPQGTTADIFSGLGSLLPFMDIGLGAKAVGALWPTRQFANRALFELGRNEELPVDFMDNFITGNTILGKGFGLKGKTWKGRLGYGSLNVPIEMGGEYTQEGHQTRATQKYQGLPYTESPFTNFLQTGEMFSTPEERSAATSGAIGGLLPAIGGTIYNSAFGGKYNEESANDINRNANLGDKNILGVENYDMQTQGDNITEQVSQLKPGWSSIIPQIGGALKEKFGLNATISSAARSAEHNAEVGGVINSQHLKGTAADITIPQIGFDKAKTIVQSLDFDGTGFYPPIERGGSWFIHVDTRNGGIGSHIEWFD